VEPAGMKPLRTFLAEPLFQFLLIGALVLALWTAMGRSGDETQAEVIEIGPGRILQLRETFARAWQRPPTQQELDGLIEAFVKEEVFYRTAVRMGLDRDDTILRRRMQQKLEFLLEPEAADLEPAPGELEAWLAANRDAYRVPALVSFQHVFFDPARRGDALEADMAAVLERLGDGVADPAAGETGDRTLLPMSLPLTQVNRIADTFGPELAAALGEVPVGRWSGPVRSTFGSHLVLVRERAPARDPDLADVRSVVLRDWQAARRRDVAAQRYRTLRDGFEVRMTGPETGQDGSGG